MRTIVLLWLVALAACERNPEYRCRFDGNVQPCDPHYFCAAAGYCQPASDLGEACHGDQLCDADLACGTDALCYQPGQPGEPCSALHPCINEPLGGDIRCLLGHAGDDLTEGVCSDPEDPAGLCSWRFDPNSFIGTSFGCQVGAACHPTYVFFDPDADGPPPSAPICTSSDCGMPGDCGPPGGGQCADNAGCTSGSCALVDPPCWAVDGDLECWDGPPHGVCSIMYQPNGPCDPALELDPTNCTGGTVCGFRPLGGYQRVCDAEHTYGVGETCGDATDAFDDLCAFGLVCADPGPTCQLP